MTHSFQFFIVGIMHDVWKNNIPPPRLRQSESYQEWPKRFKFYVSLHDNDLARAVRLAALVC